MSKKYITVTLIILLVASLIFLSSYLQNIFFLIADQAEYFTSRNTILALALFIVLASLSAMISPFSSAPLVPIAIILWGTNLTSILLFFGWLLGDLNAYLVGRYAGHKLLKLFIAEDSLKKYEDYLSRRMNFTKALLLRIALPGEIGYGFGLINYSFPRYAIVTIVAEALFVIITVQASDALVTLNYSAFIGWVSALILIVSTFYYLFQLKSKRK